MTNTVEQYVPDRDEWISLQPMNAGRQLGGLVAMGDVLYAIGGYERAYSPSVERIDMRMGKGWEYVCPMIHPRMGFGALVHGTTILVNGGFAAAGNGITVMSSMERYEQRMDKWEEMPQLNYPRRRFGFVKMKLYNKT